MRYKRSISVSLVLLSLSALPGAAPEDRVEKVDFNYHIRPLLSDRCFPCHGPDEKTRMARLRLDREERALRAVKDGMFVIKPGDPGRSEVVRRLTSNDPAVMMPPPWSKLTVNLDEIALIRRW